MTARLVTRPLTPERWDDFVALFGPRGACAGCWCMWWRLSRKTWEAQKGDGNRAAMQAIVAGGEVPGLLAYRGREAVGWCAIAPREVFASLERSRVMARLDDLPVWSLPCLFVRKDARGQGVALALVEAAVAWARRHRAPAVEAYPTITRGKRLATISSFLGTPELFARAGFTERARTSASRMIVRLDLIPARQRRKSPRGRGPGRSRSPRRTEEAS